MLIWEYRISVGRSTTQERQPVLPVHSIPVERIKDRLRALSHLDDIEATDQLTIDVQLWVCWPVRVLLKALSHLVM